MNPEVAKLLQAANKFEEKSDWDGALKVYQAIIEFDPNAARP
jgi:regulator of sirC expression with transglutaminase-like and TPR domain